MQNIIPAQPVIPGVEMRMLNLHASESQALWRIKIADA